MTETKKILLKQIEEKMESILKLKNLSLEDAEGLRQYYNELAELIKTPKRLIRETINTTATDNVHLKFEFNVPTDVFGAMMVAASEILSPLRDNTGNSLFEQIKNLSDSSDMLTKLKLFAEMERILKTVNDVKKEGKPEEEVGEDENAKRE